jgi:hypothetical protein
LAGEYKFCLKGERNQAQALSRESQLKLIFFSLFFFWKKKIKYLDDWASSPDNSADRLVELIVHSGVEAQDYSAIAKKEHLKPLELELRRIEDTVEMIQKDFEYMREREAVMRDTNESTFTRVSYLSLFSVGCLIALALWQLFYLKRYFTRKKLL